MGDMLIKQLKGKYNYCKLSCQTYADPLIYREPIVDVEKLVKQRMVQEVATGIVNNQHHVKWTVGPPDRDFIGKRYLIEGYLMDEETLEQLITNAFAAGVESVVKV